MKPNAGGLGRIRFEVIVEVGIDQLLKGARLATD
jgi:hypothetical protein